MSRTLGCLVITIVPNAVTATARRSLLGISPAVCTSLAHAAATNIAGSQSAAGIAVFMVLAGLMVLGLGLIFALHRRRPTPARA